MKAYSKPSKDICTRGALDFSVSRMDVKLHGVDGVHADPHGAGRVATKSGWQQVGSAPPRVPDMGSNSLCAEALGWALQHPLDFCKDRMRRQDAAGQGGSTEGACGHCSGGDTAWHPGWLCRSCWQTLSSGRAGECGHRAMGTGPLCVFWREGPARPDAGLPPSSALFCGITGLSSLPFKADPTDDSCVSPASSRGLYLQSQSSTFLTM